MAVTFQPHGSTLRVVHVSPAAATLGIAPGQTLAHAQALAPTLLAWEDEPLRARAQLEALAMEARRFAPLVQLEGEDTLLLDVTGCARLFHGERNLLDRARAALQTRGFTVRGALADTAAAAWALAHAHAEAALVVAPGQTAASLAPLPVAALRLEASMVAALHAVGVETIEALLRLPRAALAARFGEALARRLSQALGETPEVLVPFARQPTLSCRQELGAATDRLTVLQEVLHRLLADFCRTLDQRRVGICRMFVTFEWLDVTLERGSRQQHETFALNVAQPTRVFARLWNLLATRLGDLRLPAPVYAVQLWARHLEPLDDEQGELFITDYEAIRARRDLLDRLALRLGVDAVVRAEALSDHQPERACRYVPLVGPAAGQPSRRRPAASGKGEGEVSHFVGAQAVTHHRPVRLLPVPVAISATAIVPDGPPITFRLHGRQQVVASCVGPERIETGWWRGPYLRRDYYRVTTTEGRHCWLFRARDTNCWFLQGWFD